HPLLHAGLEHAVPLLSSAEEREDDEPRAAVPEVLERRGLDDDVSRHPVPLERLHDALRRDDLAIAALEAVHAIRPMLDEAPMPAALDLHALDHDLVAPAPPLRDQLRIRH